jgi:hypothetical protein
MIKGFKDFINEEKRQHTLADIPPGSKVKYDGSTYYVISSDDFTLELSKSPDSLAGDKGNFFVNAVMFSEKGFVSQ